MSQLCPLSTEVSCGLWFLPEADGILSRAGVSYIVDLILILLGELIYLMPGSPKIFSLVFKSVNQRPVIKRPLISS